MSSDMRLISDGGHRNFISTSKGLYCRRTELVDSPAQDAAAKKPSTGGCILLGAERPLLVCVRQRSRL